MSSCKDDLETALHMANRAIARLFRICPTDELLKPMIDPEANVGLWEQFRERFGDKSGLWVNQPACANAVFWQNYAKAMDVRADELIRNQAAPEAAK